MDLKAALVHAIELVSELQRQALRYNCVALLDGLLELKFALHAIGRQSGLDLPTEEVTHAGNG